jgi:hypothetical protein
MVILIVDEDCIFAVEGKGEPPVSIDADGPVFAELAGQSMPLPAGNVHLLGPGGDVEEGKLLVESTTMAGLDTSLRACLEKPFDSFVAEAPNHVERECIA